MNITYTFPGCWLHIDEDGHFLQTVFPDGARLCSVPVLSKDRDTAWRYGYGDDFLHLWREHDLLHHWIAVQFGLPCSPTIWAEAHPHHTDAIPRWARLQEEEFIATVHRWLNCDMWVDALWPLLHLRSSLEELKSDARRALCGDERTFLAPQPCVAGNGTL